MYLTSLGQMSAETAKVIYQDVGRLVDMMIISGKIVSADRSVAFAKLASQRLGEHGIQISKGMAATAKESLPAIEAILSKAAAAPAVASATPALVRGSSLVAPVVAGASQSAARIAQTTVRAGAPVAAAFFIFESVFNAVQYHKGKITKDELVKKTAKSGARNAGGLGGAAAGAALGSMIFPGPGTVIGGLVGGVAGGASSSWGVDKLFN